MLKLQISARRYEIDSNLYKYVTKKLGNLDKYLPRENRNTSMRVEIFRDPSGKEDNRYKVTAQLDLPGPDIIAETATINPHSAIDIVEQKLKVQIAKYKQKHGHGKFRIKDKLGLLRKKTPKL